MTVRLTQIDGKLPNLALMKIGRFHRDRGDRVVFSRNVGRGLFEPEFDLVYGSAIFARSKPLVERLRSEFPGAVVGGTGTDSLETVEERLGLDPNGPERIDYDDFPDFTASLGFSQRGCRLKCGFCVVPKKEGKPRSVATIFEIYRGEPYPRHIHLLDNDFFGQAEWRERLEEVRAGGFRVCFNQGINVRKIDDEVAAALGTTPYYDDGFANRTLYTAWDNLGDESLFVAGVERLKAHGTPPGRLLVYMLVGYDPKETWERIFRRFDRMLDLGVRPYPMVFDRSNADLVRFQRWVIRRYYKFVPWEKFVTLSQSERETMHRRLRDSAIQPTLEGVSP